MTPSLTWTIPETSQSDWSLTVVRQQPPAEASPGDMSEMSGTIALTELSEVELIAACLDGRAGAFDLIVERHRRSVYQLCYRFVSNHEDASDLSQDVFLRAFRGLGKFRGHSSLGTWLYRIGVNVCLNRVGAKTVKTEAIEEQQHIDTTGESASDLMLRRERAERVRAAVAKLPEKQRATLILRMYQELSHQEIAETLGGSVGAVKANVFHALQNLKKILSGKMP